jgi:hypothetical protein
MVRLGGIVVGVDGRATCQRSGDHHDRGSPREAARRERRWQGRPGMRVAGCAMRRGRFPGHRRILRAGPYNFVLFVDGKTAYVMAGHSKWANIKHKKAATDAKRGKIFTRLIKEITVSARLGGGDASANPRLRLAIDKARDQNMPKDTIDNAIKRGSGQLEGVNYEEIRYEGYGINGAAVIVDCMTDNRTRTVADVRHAFSKYGGNLGTDGSVAYLFKHCWPDRVPRPAPTRTR